MMTVIDNGKFLRRYSCWITATHFSMWQQKTKPWLLRKRRVDFYCPTYILFLGNVKIVTFVKECVTTFHIDI